MRLRRLEVTDLDEASRLLLGEGWAFPPEDLRRLLAVGAAVGADDGRLRGVAFLATYGHLAWVGNVVVASDARGVGLGERIVSELLAIARTAGARTVRLHSVHRAEALYERLGFVREGLVHAFRRGEPAPTPPRVSVEALEDPAQVRAFDAERFGADRGRLLELILRESANEGFLLRDAKGVRGYAILKTSPVASEIGPAVVRRGDAEAVGLLFDACLAAAPAGPLELAIPGANREALAAARERKLVEAFTARTMRWGDDAHAGDPASIAAAGGLEKG